MKRFGKVAAAVAAFVTMASPVSAADAASQAGNVVLVHGAFVDASGWERVSRILTDRGMTVTAVEAPLTSLADDVAATRRALDGLEGPTVLVGHSWGGVVIGEAGVDESVSALVYVSAIAPDRGETLGELLKTLPKSEGAGTIHPDDDGFLSIEPDAFARVFAGDLPADRADEMARSQRPLNGAVFKAPARNVAWRTKPTHYVLTTEDRLVAPAAQGYFAGRMGAALTVVEGSHASFISKAETVADVIVEAATGAP